jgi:hypothetical protein
LADHGPIVGEDDTIVAEGREFPVHHVQKVFAVNHVVFEPREVAPVRSERVRGDAALDIEVPEIAHDRGGRLLAGGFLALARRHHRDRVDHSVVAVPSPGEYATR